MALAKGLRALSLFIRTHTRHLTTRLTTTSRILLSTCRTTEKKLIAIHVSAIVVNIGKLFTETTAADHFSRSILIDRNRQTVVKNEKLTSPLFIPLFKAIFNNTPVELKNVLKPLFFQESGIELATNASCAIHHDLRLFGVFF